MGGKMIIFIILQLIADFFIGLTLLKHKNHFKMWMFGLNGVIKALEKELAKQKKANEENDERRI